MHFGLHVKYPLFLSDVNESLIFLIDFRKILKYEISRKSIQWETSCSMRTDRRAGRQVEIQRQTDRHDGT